MYLQFIEKGMNPCNVSNRELVTPYGVPGLEMKHYQFLRPNLQRCLILLFTGGNVQNLTASRDSFIHSNAH